MSEYKYMVDGYETMLNELKQENQKLKEANHYNWLDEQNEKLQSRLADLEKKNVNLQSELERRTKDVDAAFGFQTKLKQRLAECEKALQIFKTVSDEIFEHLELESERFYPVHKNEWAYTQMKQAMEYFKKWGGE